MIKEEGTEDNGVVKQKYTLKNLRELFEKVITLSNEQVEANKAKLIENIRSLTVFLIWGDKNNDDFFDFFCENAVLETLFNILRKTKYKEVIIEIIQSLGMFLSNIQKQTCLIYILSNNVVNEFISYHFNFLDEEIVAFYITFLKTLSLRLGSVPLGLFFNEKFNTFPLLSQAVRFFNHKDNLVRTSVRSITLTVFALSRKDPKLIQFLCHFPFVLYFVHLSCYMRDFWIKIDQTIADSNYAIFPCIFKSLTAVKKASISVNLSLFLILQIFKNFNYSPLLETILLYLFGFYIDKRVLVLISNPLKPPCSYTFKWSFTNFWDDYPDLVAKHAEIQYLRKHKSSIDFEAEEKKNLAEPEKKEKENKKVDAQKSKQTQSIMITKGDGHNKKAFSNTSSTLLDIRNYFKSDILKYESEHKRISKALGFLTIDQLHDSDDILERSPMDLSKETYGRVMNFLGFLKEGAESAPSFEKTEEISIHFERNDFREILLSFFRGEKSKDDNLILLIVVLIYTIVTKEQIKKPEVLLFCGLLKPGQMKFFEGNKFNEQSISNILSSCIKAQKLSIHRMKSLFKNAIIAEFMVENFENEWKIMKKTNFKKINLELGYQFFLPVLSENIPNLDLDLRYPAGDFESTRRDIALFFLFRDLRYSLNKKSRFPANEIDIDQLYINFNKNVSSKWEVGKFYEIDQRKLFPCNLKNKKDYCYIVEDFNNFILIETDMSNTKQNWAKILYNVSLKNIEAVIDRSEPLILIVGIKDIPSNSKEKYIDLLLKFEDHTLSLAAKKTLDDNRKLSKQFELSLLIKALENTEKDLISV